MLLVPTQLARMGRCAGRHDAPSAGPATFPMWGFSAGVPGAHSSAAGTYWNRMPRTSRECNEAATETPRLPGSFGGAEGSGARGDAAGALTSA